MELERYDNIDTLERHKKTLLEFAKRNNYFISKIYSEVVSGETISARPEMQKLLSDIEKGLWDGVLVMEVERLARGDTIDQGIVARYFKFSETKIITPTKIYDPNNEFDEEYFEFGLFMSRREYKTINRRLQNGKLLSVKEGKYLGSIAPYGYKKQKLEKQKGFTLEIIEDEAKIVKYIFELCLKGKGTTIIADELNKIGVEPKVKTYWTANTIRDMLKNPVYIGKIRWNYRKTKRITEDGEIKKIRPLNNEYLLIDGLHEPIIAEKQFDKAQKLLNIKSSKVVPKSKGLQNSLAGLIICGYCNKKMVRKPNKGGKDLLFCSNRGCKNKSSYFAIIETKIMNCIIYELKNINKLENYKTKDNNNQTDEKVLLQKELIKLNNILLKIYNSYENDIYDQSVFIKRKNQTEIQINNINAKIEKLDNTIIDKFLIPRITVFISNKDLKIKNKYKFYSLIINKIEYFKIKGGRGFKDNFKLKIFLNI